MLNQVLSKIFREMAVFLEIKGVAFKPQAYEKVSEVLENLEEDVKDIYKNGDLKALENIPGVGASIAEHIEEYIKTGHIKNYEKLKKELPVDIECLRSVEGVGPKTILLLYKKLKIKNLEKLEEAAKAGKIRKIKGLGEKTEQKILKGIEFVKSSGGRLILGYAVPIAKTLLEKIRSLPGVELAEFGGSLRRRQETIGDLDFIAFSDNPTEIINKFLKFPEIKHVYTKGEYRALVRLDIDMDADISVVSPKSFGAAMIAWTGNKHHNIAIRAIAEKKGWLLNDYGLWKNKQLLASKTEEEVYQKLGMDWIPPEIRNDSGEIKAALEGKLPKLVGYEDLKGDLQVQTDWTDGKHSIKEMAGAAQKMGLEYICITDHTKSLAMTGGSDEKRLLKQMAAIDEVNREFKSSKFKVLKGAEVNIMKDGTLDIDDEILAKLDVVGAAVHQNFNMSEGDMTNRIIRAVENPNVDIIFHPTGRIINKRPAYPVNVEELLKAAKRTKTVMEIDAFPDRLDLKDEYIRKGVEMGVKFAIDSDAHHIYHLQYLEYGIAQARRGWATKTDIINTRSWQEMLKLLK
ncbi:MAG: DNA polymerase III [Candidatus Yanofskybacteria bacterium RIFCSPHIGHO2_02_FULL_38_22b]|uniref:DNA polymerase beta n=1 Tax=Candidatus Yanofskybacteria bacterium RIFCSPHIGHO2_02_FULL_38_22b TaxID=1802673 RepID=A0A1F8F357_9BACT|nr:MAG: DNA polymerase III [Candidatus Yanofskybacteria bacterium RIFCSPHIGHO2_01_FULL_39_44]OGN07563.1 MAG: DNA polymerase III [Candidatus Yanofskybacteria bacterium RIFCSPHIGHO2_02_FULL_38_22b]OGN20192.1 MAG: DNA polymerase III [Candidatus Yanofskybacteria bacterium RIFCSPLOWO2_01_FULL_39_28]